ncbi:MAG: hypothetical protein BWZ08_01115 [candidate division BRC1 bacterium ADurb.BinA292]|nr:MAG: hypothetical protein BWZ08_01115 [candidate division BRC1 bacterium ADurb.BinA292]
MGCKVRGTMPAGGWARALLFAMAAWTAMLGARATADPPAGAEELDAAFAALAGYSWEGTREPLTVIDAAIAQSRGDEAARAELETRLMAVLGGDAPQAAKKFACERLSLIGSGRSVAALASLLGDRELAHPARLALERIPDPAVDAALIGALETTDGDLLRGTIGSIGNRGVAGATAPLTQWARDDAASSETVLTAIRALGMIGTAESARALGELQAEAPAELRDAITDARLIAARRMQRAGLNEEAAALYREVLALEGGERWRAACLRGLVDAEPEHAREHLAEALAGEDARLMRVAAETIADADDPAAVRHFSAMLSDLPRASQVILLDTLRSQLGTEARDFARGAVRSDAAELRLAAIRALGFVGDETDLAELIRAAQSEVEAERDAARTSLELLPAEATGAQLVAMLPAADPGAQAEIIAALAARREVDSLGTITDYLDAENNAVRAAGWEALATMGTLEQLPVVIEHLQRAEGNEAPKPVREALQAIVRREREAALPTLLSSLSEAPVAARVALLHSLALLGTGEALEAVRAAVGESDPAIKDGAVRTLTEWPTVEAAPDLLRIAREGEKPVWRILALRSYIQLVRGSDATREEKLEQLRPAIELAVNAEEKRRVISALGELAIEPTLAVLSDYMDDPDVVEEASAAVIGVAGPLRKEHREEVDRLLNLVLERSKNPDHHQWTNWLLHHQEE